MQKIHKENILSQVKDYVKEQIISGHYAPGEKISPIRDLAASLHVSHVTVAKAIQELASEGILSTHVGAGTYVSQAMPKKAHINASKHRLSNVYFLFDNAENRIISNYHRDVLCVLQKEGEKHGWSVKVASLDDESLQSADADPNAIGIVHATSLQRHPALRVPVICYGVQEDDFYPTVTPDNYRAGWDAGSLYVASHAYDGVYFVAGTIQKEAKNVVMDHFLERFRGIQEALRELGGIELPPILHWNLALGIWREVDELLKRIKRSNSGRPVLLFVANHTIANEIYIYALSRKLRIPEELSLITFVKRGSNSGSLPIDTFDFNHVTMGQYLASLLQNSLLGYELPTRIQIPMTFFPRGSSLQ